MIQSDEAAFEAIYRRYAKTLISFAHKTISSYDDCQEIIQDVFVSLWIRRESIQIVSLRHYLYSSVRYKIIRYIQHNKVRQKYAEHFRLFGELVEAAEPLSESGRADPAAIVQRIDELITALPDRCRTAFQLRLHENLSNTEIAERMNISKKTVEVYMFKAFAYLREMREQALRTDVGGGS